MAIQADLISEGFLTGDVPEMETCFSKNMTTFGQEIMSILKQQEENFCELPIQDEEECKELQEEELSALVSILAEDITMTEGETLFKVNISSLLKSSPDSETSTDDDVSIWFRLLPFYPSVVPVMEIESEHFLSLSEADQLFNLMLEEATLRRQQMMLYDLVLMAKDFLGHVAAKKKLMQASSLEDKTFQGKEDVKERQDADSSDEICYESLQSYNYQNVKPSVYTGPMQKILDKIPSDYEVVSVENIMRRDLAECFDAAISRCANKYARQARNHPEEYAIAPIFAFHGTSSTNIPNIVRIGLQVPGEESGIAIANGASYGVGIYLSGDPCRSISYCENNENAILLVCGLLLGRMLKKPLNGVFDPASYDSIATSSFYVVFNAHQVLPCYAIRVVSKRHLNNVGISRALTVHSSIKERERKLETETMRQERLRERARKFLPFGFGPVSSKKRLVVILDVADSSDDEEGTMGDYQEYRK